MFIIRKARLGSNDIVYADCDENRFHSQQSDSCRGIGRYESREARLSSCLGVKNYCSARLRAKYRLKWLWVRQCQRILRLIKIRLERSVSRHAGIEQDLKVFLTNYKSNEISHAYMNLNQLIAFRKQHYLKVLEAWSHRVTSYFSGTSNAQAHFLYCASRRLDQWSCRGFAWHKAAEPFNRSGLQDQSIASLYMQCIAQCLLGIIFGSAIHTQRRCA